MALQWRAAGVCATYRVCRARMSAVWGPSDGGMEGLGSPHGNSGFRFVEISFLKRAKKQLPSPVMGTTYDFAPPSCLGTLHRPHIILKPVLVPQHHVVGFCHVRPVLGHHRCPAGGVNCQPGDPMGSPSTRFEIGLSTYACDVHVVPWVYPPTTCEIRDNHVYTHPGF